MTISQLPGPNLGVSDLVMTLGHWIIVIIVIIVGAVSMASPPVPSFMPMATNPFEDIGPPGIPGVF